MIYVLEGPDGVGKSTLAEEISKIKGATVVHPYYNKRWNMQEYHTAFIQFAEHCNDFEIPVVLDRWAPSEFVYGHVFRKGESFDTRSLIDYYRELLKDELVFIYCRNDNAVENHLKNKEEREEMFDSMAEVMVAFDAYVKGTPEFNWHMYDYDKVDMTKFTKELPGANKAN